MESIYQDQEGVQSAKKGNDVTITVCLLLAISSILVFATLTKYDGHTGGWQFFSWYAVAFILWPLLGLIVVLRAFHLYRKKIRSGFIIFSIITGFVFLTFYPAFFLTEKLKHTMFSDYYAEIKRHEEQQVQRTLDMKEHLLSSFERALQDPTFKVVGVHGNHIYFTAQYFEKTGSGEYKGIAYLPNTNPILVEQYLTSRISLHSYTAKILVDRNELYEFTWKSNQSNSALNPSEEGIFLLKKYTKNKSNFYAQNTPYLDWDAHLKSYSPQIAEYGLARIVYSTSLGTSFNADIPIELYEDGIFINDKFK